jgi:hypothetical protein
MTRAVFPPPGSLQENQASHPSASVPRGQHKKHRGRDRGEDKQRKNIYREGDELLSTRSTDEKIKRDDINTF